MSDKLTKPQADALAVLLLTLMAPELPKSKEVDDPALSPTHSIALPTRCNANSNQHGGNA